MIRIVSGEIFGTVSPAANVPAMKAIGPLAKATLRSGATPLPGNQKGVNDTYLGIIYTEDFDQPAFVKDLDRTQLINELTAAVVGRLADLPIPEPFLVAVPATACPFSKGPLLADGTTRLAFGTANSGGMPIRQLVSAVQALPPNSVQTWSFLTRVICFDELIANGDRHDANLLFAGRDGYFLIDHSHAFTGPNWVAESLNPDSSINNQLLEGWLRQHLPEQKRQAIARDSVAIENQFARFDFETAVACSYVADLAGAEAANALVKFLRARSKRIARTISEKAGFPVLV